MKLMNNKTIKYDKNNIQNVLINSNFLLWNILINRKLAKILKMKYNLQPIYEFKAVQKKFYYNSKNDFLVFCSYISYGIKKKKKKFIRKCLL